MGDPFSNTAWIEVNDDQYRAFVFARPVASNTAATAGSGRTAADDGLGSIEVLFYPVIKAKKRGTTGTMKYSHVEQLTPPSLSQCMTDNNSILKFASKLGPVTSIPSTAPCSANKPSANKQLGWRIDTSGVPLHQVKIHYRTSIQLSIESKGKKNYRLDSRNQEIAECGKPM